MRICCGEVVGNVGLRKGQTSSALHADTHHSHPQSPFLYPDIQTFERKFSLFLAAVCTGIFGIVLGSLGCGHLRFEDRDEPVVFSELRLQMVTKALLDHANAGFPFAPADKRVDTYVEVADLC